MRETPPDIDWNALRALRDLFLSGEPIPEAYWVSRSQLEAYDHSLGERIGWKWDAVLEELRLRGWNPPSSNLCDLGCGTGIAARRLLQHFPGAFEEVELWDHSAIAMGYAREKILEEFPGVRVSMHRSAPQPECLTLISHVLTELEDEQVESLLASLEAAPALIWVEPGTHASGRRLQLIREVLAEHLSIHAPCTHQASCGLLADDMENHWCHHFAVAPPGAHQSSFWGHFRKEMNLELSPVAYSFLACGEEALPELPAASHLIGAPLRFPKFLRALSCQEEGVREFVCSRRADNQIYRNLKNQQSPAVYQFELRKNRISGGQWIGETEKTSE